MGDHRDMAFQAAHKAGFGEDRDAAVGQGLAAIALALLEVSDAIREASKSSEPSEKTNPLNTSRDW